MLLNVNEYSDLGLIKLDIDIIKTYDMVYLIILSMLYLYNCMMTFAFWNFFKMTSKNFKYENNDSEDQLRNDPENS